MRQYAEQARTWLLLSLCCMPVAVGAQSHDAHPKVLQDTEWFTLVNRPDSLMNITLRLNADGSSVYHVRIWHFVSGAPTDSAPPIRGHWYVQADTALCIVLTTAACAPVSVYDNQMQWSGQSWILNERVRIRRIPHPERRLNWHGSASADTTG